MAEKLLSESTTIDPGYAPAFAQLGITYLFLGENAYGSIPVSLAREKSKLNLDKALQLAPKNPEALSGMGLYVYTYELDHEKAIDLLQQAVAINPNLTDANTWLANQLNVTGRLQEGLQLREQIFKRDPLHRATFGNLIQNYQALGQNEKALETLVDLQTYLPGDTTILGDYGQYFLMTGQLAEARQNFKKSYDGQPLDSVNNFWYGMALIDAKQYEQASKIAPAFAAPLALGRLGRLEEALIMGRRAIDDGRAPNFYFQALVENGRFAELIDELESRWPSLDDFSRDWPGLRGYGYFGMGYIAQAYREVGNEEKFGDAMQILKTSLETQIAEGADNKVLNMSHAYYAVLAGDYESAVSLLEKAFQQGAYIDTTSKIVVPLFKPLDGNPRYEAAKAAMVARLNAELETMNLEELPVGEGS